MRSNEITIIVLCNLTFSSKNRLWEQIGPLFESCADQVVLLNMCWKLEFLVPCARPLLGRLLVCNDELHAISSLLKKRGSAISKPLFIFLYFSPLSSFRSTPIHLPLFHKKNSKPSSPHHHKHKTPILFSTKNGTNSWWELIFQAKAILKQHRAKWLSMQSTSHSSPPPCEVSKGMDVTLSPSYSITPFTFGFLKSLDLQLVGLTIW